MQDAHGRSSTSSQRRIPRRAVAGLVVCVLALVATPAAAQTGVWSWDLGEGTLTMTDTGAGLVLRWDPAAPAPTAVPAPDPPSSPPPMLTPFPIVRLSGVVTARGARILRLTVQAPRGAGVAVRCRAKGCPFRRVSRTASGRAMRFRRVERPLRAGTVIEVLVSDGVRIGKYTRFVIRRGERPRRTDLCLWPGASRGSACPLG